MAEIWKNHWHCILPSVGLLTALFVMLIRDKLHSIRKSTKENDTLPEVEHNDKE